MFIGPNEDTFRVGQSLKRIHDHFKGSPCSFFAWNTPGCTLTMPVHYLLYLKCSKQRPKRLLYTFEKISLWFYLNWMIFSLFFRRFSFLNSSLACFGTSFFISFGTEPRFILYKYLWRVNYNFKFIYIDFGLKFLD